MPRTVYIVGSSASAGVTSFNSRTGDVTPGNGDYTVGQISNAAPLANPNFTGLPTAPTQGAGDNSTRLATTAYVDKSIVPVLVGSGGSAPAFLNNFTNLGTGQVPVSYCMLSGIVFIEGAWEAHGTVASGLPIFQLPIGSRPANGWQGQYSGITTPSGLQIDSSGNVALTYPVTSLQSGFISAFFFIGI